MKKLLIAGALCVGLAGVAGAAKVTVDAGQAIGPVKPVNSVGQPPLIGGPGHYWMLHYLKDAGIPYSRLHDVGGRYGRNVYADIPNLFRNFDADENDPKNYDFAFTDDLIHQLATNNVKPWFRLGVTIENYPKIAKYRIFPPKDYAKWARICEHVIRHYNEGWANGMKLGIEYWEIWNEADLNPNPDESMTWAGTFDQYCEFYGVAARHLKGCFPHLKIGGPASCGLYAADNPMARGQVRYHVDCCKQFLDYVRDNKVPMDFFSFHSYASAKNVMQQVAAARRLLNERGLGAAETWLNEWLCHHKHEYLGTAFQAAGIAAELIGLQNSEVSGACIYDARCGVGDYSPLFNPLTYKPHKAYYVFTAFNELRKLGTAVKATSDSGDVWVTAAARGSCCAVMLANETNKPIPLEFDFGEMSFSGCRITDRDRTAAKVDRLEALPPESFCVIWLKK